MEKLTAELRRLYLPDPQHPTSQALEQHQHGGTTFTIDLACNGADGTRTARALVLDFPREPDGRHWQRLCDVANALQQELQLPAPAVSVNGGNHYSLWLSFEQPLPLDQLRQFHALLHRSLFSEVETSLGVTQVELPPCLHRATDLWAAFINPAMGASLADDLGLELPPPLAAQAAFLASVERITPEQYAHALQVLGAKHGEVTGVSASEVLPMTSVAPVGAAVNMTTTQRGAHAQPGGVLLHDATLEDIVAELHRRRIEPTLRHLLP